MSGSFESLVDRLFAQVESRPHAEAIVHDHQRVTYGALASRIVAVADMLRKGGIQQGDHVALLLSNSPDYVAAYYGALAVGASAIGLTWAARGREIAAELDHCAPKWLFTDSRHPDFAALGQHYGRGLHLVCRAAPDGAIGWPEDGQEPSFERTPVRASDRAAVIYTSGTTGRPKGVVLTHGNLVANTLSIIECLRLEAADRVLTALPFSYWYGGSVLHTHLAVGGTVVIENTLAFAHSIVSRMQAERITGFPGVPSTFALLLHTNAFAQGPPPCLRYVTQAGGAMSHAHLAQIRTQMPRVRFIVMYGQTEATARLTCLPPERLDDKPGSVGLPIPGVQIQISDERNESVAPRVAGEVCVRGPNIMAGYLGDEEATAAVLRDGWLHTGDVGSLDEDGYLYLQGRRGDMIKSGAYRVNPAEVEEVICGLSEVREAAVIGVVDPVLGEAIKAVVCLAPGIVLNGRAVQRHCAQHLARYKVPRLIEFAVRLPRTSSGKLLRRSLAEAHHEHADSTHFS